MEVMESNTQLAFNSLDLYFMEKDAMVSLIKDLCKTKKHNVHIVFTSQILKEPSIVPGVLGGRT